MVFPVTRLSLKVELQLSGTWTDVTSYTRVEDGVTITRGRRDEAGSFEPGDCSIVLNNRDGRFSPRNPTGAYYGSLTRNTPMRVSVSLGTRRLIGTGSVTAPDTAGLSVTGDIDIRFDGNLPAWTRQGNLLSKAEAAGTYSWWVWIDTAGLLRFDWSTDGTAVLTSQSTVPLPQTVGRQAVRVTIDVNNGAAGRTITFYTAPTASGSWTQLGSTVVQAGTTSIFNSTAQVRVNAFTGWNVYSAEIRNGIGGSLVGNPVFSSQSELAASFADAQGNTWTVPGTGAVTDRHYRFYGEVPSWPQSWDLSEHDVWVTVQAAGILRRLGQGSAPLDGPIQRFVKYGAVPTYAYWPLEDASGATSIASGIPGGTAMQIYGAPDLASDDTTFPASNALPIMTTGSILAGTVNSYAATGTIFARCLMLVPAAGEATTSVVLRVFTTGTAAVWDIELDSAGNLTMEAYDSTFVQLFSSGAAFAVNGKPLILVMQLVQNGANVDWKILTIGYTNDVGLEWNGTLNTRTIGAATQVQISPAATLTGTVIGHVALNAALPGDIEAPLRGYSGETAGTRVARLCTEESIPFTSYGSPTTSVAMGVQRPGQLLDLFAECESSDFGQLFETRDQVGLGYRTGGSRNVQTAALAIAYTALRDLAPVEDDQNTRNDVTVVRVGGSSARATLDTGSLSTLAPPSGVGRYDDSVELSLAADSQLADQASLRVALGTIDEPRYPVLSAQLAGTAFAASAALTDAALVADHGDRITVTGAPVWVPPGTIDQHTIGQVETLGVREYGIDFVCQPARPIGAAGLYDLTTSRWDASGSTLNATMTTSATSVTVATTAGQPLWTTADTPLDIVVAGEQITVGAISGASSPQTFSSLTRAVNGVVKAHLAGEAVQLADPIYYAL